MPYAQDSRTKTILKVPLHFMGPLSFYVHTNEFTSLEAFIPSIFKVLTLNIRILHQAPGR